MELIKEADLRKELKGEPRLGYLFFGEEDYLKLHAMRTAEELISPDETFAFFNVIRLDALEFTPSKLLEALMPMPMMADRKLITVTGIDLSSMKPNEIDGLCAALSTLEEYDYNTVIISVASDRFDAGNVYKRPSKLLVRLSELMTPVYFEKNSPARLYSWIAKHYRHNGVDASADVCRLTVERCGRDMFTLASETDKVSFFVLSQGRSEVTAADVEHVCIPASDFDTFALSTALTAGNRDEALNVLADMKFRRVDPIIIMSEITTNICDSLSVELLAADGLTSREISEKLRMHEYRVSLILNARRGVDRLKMMLEKCRQADLDIKLWRNGYDVLECLICTI